MVLSVLFLSYTERTSRINWKSINRLANESCGQLWVGPMLIILFYLFYLGRATLHLNVIGDFIALTSRYIYN